MAHSNDSGSLAPPSIFHQFQTFVNKIVANSRIKNDNRAFENDIRSNLKSSDADEPSSNKTISAYNSIFVRGQLNGPSGHAEYENRALCTSSSSGAGFTNDLLMQPCRNSNFILNIEAADLILFETCDYNDVSTDPSQYIDPFAVPNHQLHFSFSFNIRDVNEYAYGEVDDCATTDIEHNACTNTSSRARYVYCLYDDFTIELRNLEMADKLRTFLSSYNQCTVSIPMECVFPSVSTFYRKNDLQCVQGALGLNEVFADSQNIVALNSINIENDAAVCNFVANKLLELKTNLNGKNSQSQNSSSASSNIGSTVSSNEISDVEMDDEENENDLDPVEKLKSQCNDDDLLEINRMHESTGGHFVVVMNIPPTLQSDHFVRLCHSLSIKGFLVVRQTDDFIKLKFAYGFNAVRFHNAVSTSVRYLGKAKLMLNRKSRLSAR